MTSVRRQRDLLHALVEAIDHLEHCGQCGEDSLSACRGGRNALAARDEARTYLVKTRKTWRCEGCGAEAAHGTLGWAQCGTSQRGRAAKSYTLAVWCPQCRKKGRDRFGAEAPPPEGTK